jgi:hypothetical protein
MPTRFSFQNTSALGVSMLSIHVAPSFFGFSAVADDDAPRVFATGFSEPVVAACQGHRGAVPPIVP